MGPLATGEEEGDRTPPPQGAGGDRTLHRQPTGGLRTPPRLPRDGKRDRLSPHARKERPPPRRTRTASLGSDTTSQPRPRPRGPKPHDREGLRVADNAGRRPERDTAGSPTPPPEAGETRETGAPARAPSATTRPDRGRAGKAAPNDIGTRPSHRNRRTGEVGARHLLFPQAPKRANPRIFKPPRRNALGTWDRVGGEGEGRGREEPLLPDATTTPPPPRGLGPRHRRQRVAPETTRRTDPAPGA